MTQHQRQIIRAVLQVLADLSGGLFVEWQLFGAIAGRVNPMATMSDFEAALKEAEQLKWILGITGKLGERKWAITDLGEAARRELQ
jgi:hypothetical protein